MKGLHEDKSYHNLTVYREDVRVSPINGPYWTSNINCVGTEDNLSQCDMVELGTVTSCENHHYAGVLCYDNEGMLTGNTLTNIVEQDGNLQIAKDQSVGVKGGFSQVRGAVHYPNFCCLCIPDSLLIFSN